MPTEDITRIRFHHKAAGDDPAFRQGVSFTFANGYTLSIQCGSTNYCERTGVDSAANAEIAVIDHDGEWATRAVVAGALGEELDDDVRARTTVEEIAKIMAHLEGWIE